MNSPSLQPDETVITTEITVDSSIYSTDAVKKACYKNSDKYSAKIAAHDKLDSTLVLTLHFHNPVSKSELDIIINELNMDIVDYDLRERIYKETEQTRNLILAYAFADTSLTED